ncbi:uncharacterized protein BO96DRAFT_436836 [Aspergillus niger CBS 101883]|uniref:Uncharacterized protein n=2 Tax=Aspergillus niger TaxID=5061 RepID=A2QY80_ASPNC|nr:uncharacterized protein BO96DRAFT_436836 [Aspergillus niger CBS 101883]XP_059601741.1 hypothetical protein An12g00310 [Aspergillus niger]PYH53538.1 hypothetical protein BO96DRAFT_436836 [Aspergillus niger CBS 101883]CAK40960.1 hypothetical protein An12g00310 [Aspergillus niger]
MKVAYPQTTTGNCKTIGEMGMLQTILDESSSASVEPANRQAYRLARATTAKPAIRSMVVVAVNADGLLDQRKSGCHCHTTGEDVPYYYPPGQGKRYNWQKSDIYTVSRCSRKNGRGPSALDSTYPLADLPTRDNSGKDPIETGTTLDWLKTVIRDIVQPGGGGVPPSTEEIGLRSETRGG